MRSKHILYTFIVLSGMVACSSSNRKFNISGDLAGMPEQKVILEQINANDQISIVDSVQSKADGHFELKGIAPEPGLYRIHFSSTRFKFILLSVDKGNIKVDGDWNTIENYKVSGSAESQDLKDFLVAIRVHLKEYHSMSIVLDSLQKRGNDSLLNEIGRAHV